MSPDQGASPLERTALPLCLDKIPFKTFKKRHHDITMLKDEERDVPECGFDVTLLNWPAR